jgi:hypothetical protein
MYFEIIQRGKIMKLFNKAVALAMALCIGVISEAGVASGASVYDNFSYHKGDKMYRENVITKGTKHLKKHTGKGKGVTQYQIVKMTSNRILLRPQKGYWSSEDPYFKTEVLTYPLSSKCKFYYRDVSYPYLQSSVTRYKKVSKKNVYQYMSSKDFRISYGYIEGEKENYYYSGYFGNVYLKNGKVAVILTDGGD